MNLLADLTAGAVEDAEGRAVERPRAAVEAAVRPDLAGLYIKAQYSQARGDHWRTTIAMAALGGDADDFLGQYRRNSHVVLSVRYSF